MSLEFKKSKSLEYKVKESDLAINLEISKDDDFPAVFATARMIALMESSAALVLKDILVDDELSVGVEVNIKHLAPTLCDDTVSCTAIFEEMLGKLYKFSLEVKDSSGLVGSGTHTRAIVSKARLMSGANKRALKS